LDLLARHQKHACPLSSRPTTSKQATCWKPIRIEFGPSPHVQSLGHVWETKPRGTCICQLPCTFASSCLLTLIQPLAFSRAPPLQLLLNFSHFYFLLYQKHKHSNIYIYIYIIVLGFVCPNLFSSIE
jgi:hypothetical protein